MESKNAQCDHNANNDETKKPPKERQNAKSRRSANRGSQDDRQRKRRGNKGHGTNRSQNQSRNNGTNVGVVAALNNMQNKMGKLMANHTVLMAEAEDALMGLQPNSGPSGDNSWLPSSRGPGPGGPVIVGPPGNCRGSHCKGNPWIDNGTPWPNSGPVTIPKPTGEYRPTDPVVPQPIEKVEGISASTIRRYMRMKRSQFRYCYVNHAMASNPRAAGIVKVSFIISKKGIVLNVKVTRSTLNHRATEQCLSRAIKRIKFPKTGGGTAFVTYPIRFRAVGRR